MSGICAVDPRAAAPVGSDGGLQAKPVKRWGYRVWEIEQLTGLPAPTIRSRIAKHGVRHAGIHAPREAASYRADDVERVFGIASDSAELQGTTLEDLEIARYLVG